MCNPLECVNAHKDRGDNVDDWVEGPCAENPGELKAENKRLRANFWQLSDHPLVIEQGGTTDADRAVRVMNRQQAKIERLQALVDKLPKTEDGVPVVPGMVLWNSAGERYAPVLGVGETIVNGRYSTRKAADAAREK